MRLISNSNQRIDPVDFRQTNNQPRQPPTSAVDEQPINHQKANKHARTGDEQQTTSRLHLLRPARMISNRAVNNQPPSITSHRQTTSMPEQLQQQQPITINQAAKQPPTTLLATRPRLRGNLQSRRPRPHNLRAHPPPATPRTTCSPTFQSQPPIKLNLQSDQPRPHN